MSAKRPEPPPPPGLPPFMSPPGRPTSPAPPRPRRDDIVETARAIRKGHRQTEAATLVENSLRWCGNILTEVCGNHGEHVDEETRDALRDAIQAVHKASHIARKRQGV